MGGNGLVKVLLGVEKWRLQLHGENIHDFVSHQIKHGVTSKKWSDLTIFQQLLSLLGECKGRRPQIGQSAAGG